MSPFVAFCLWVWACWLLIRREREDLGVIQPTRAWWASEDRDRPVVNLKLTRRGKR